MLVIRAIPGQLPVLAVIAISNTPLVTVMEESGVMSPGVVVSRAVVSNVQLLFVSTVPELKLSVKTGARGLMTDTLTWLMLMANA